MLANPRIRVRNREKAKILIGDRVPNITTTTTATGFVAENILYVDVGLKLDVEPAIYLDDEVAIRLTLEVSTIVSQVQTKTGTLAYQIGTRTAATALRLKDGENQVLAGLINDEDRSNANKVPALGEIPLLGRLFGSQLDNAQKTEIVLSITPKLIRGIQRPNHEDGEFESGTESSFKLRTVETAPAQRDGTVLADGSVAPGPGSPPVLASVAALTGGAPRPVPAPSPTSTSAPVQATGAQLTWAGGNQAKVGSSFTAQLMVQSGEPIRSVPLAIGYDPKLLEAVAVNEGDFLKQGGASTNFSSRIDKATGQIFGTINRAGESGASGAGTLLTVTFKALAPAQAARAQLLTISAIGLTGKAVATGVPPSLTLNVLP